VKTNAEISRQEYLENMNKKLTGTARIGKMQMQYEKDGSVYGPRCWNFELSYSKAQNHALQHQLHGAKKKIDFVS
jgi:hypothetical protein